MKKSLLMHILLIIASFFLAENVAGKTTRLKINQVEKQQQIDSLLYDIENKINNSLTQCFVSGSDEKLIDLSVKLNNLSTEKKQGQIISYWRAYLNYYLAIYYISKKKNELSEKSIENGIKMLKNINNKNSEDLALLALMQSFSIQFKRNEAMFISKNISENANNSVKLNSSNLRGYYVLASQDFYTPEEYGGGQKVEEYLHKAISLPIQKVPNKYLPSWGKEESYELLVRYYIKKERWEEAKKYFKEGLALFPQSYQLKQLASQLVDK